MNNAEHEPLITKVDPLPFEVTRDQYESVAHRFAQKIAEKPITFTFWEQVALKFDATVMAMKFIGEMTPHIINIVWSFLMGNKTKLGAAIVGLVVAVLGHFDILVPEQLVGVIDVVVALLIGWFIPSPKTNNGNE